MSITAAASAANRATVPDAVRCGALWCGAVRLRCVRRAFSRRGAERRLLGRRERLSWAGTERRAALAVAHKRHIDAYVQWGVGGVAFAP